MENVSHFVNWVFIGVCHQGFEEVQSFHLVHLEQEDEGISLCAEIAICQANLLDVVNEIFNQLHACVLEYIINAHDSISTNVKVSVVKVLRHGFHQVFENRLEAYL